MTPEPENPVAQTEPATERRRLRTAWLILGLVVLGALAYANAIDHPFLYDDGLLVLRNPEIRSLSNLPQIVGFQDGGFILRDRFTRNVTHALEYAVAGTWAPLYHLDNVLLHVTLGLLVFLLARRLTGDRLVGWWAAALFLAHPIHTEVVAQVAGRRGLLAGIFTLSFLLLIQRYLVSGGRWRVAAAMAVLFLGVYSKQNAAMAPAAVLLLDLYLGGQPSSSRSLRQLLAEVGSRLLARKWLYGGLVVATLALIGSFIFLSEEAIGLDGTRSPYEKYGPSLNPFDRAGIVGLALRMFALPLGQSADYNYDALGLTQGSTWSPIGLLNLALVGLAATGMVWGLVRRNWLGFGLAWFFVFYVPHMGFLPWHYVFAERFLYLPSVGLCLVGAVGIVRLIRTAPAPRYATAAACALLAVLTVTTLARNTVWASGERLWTNAVERYPDSARAHNFLGTLNLRERRPERAVEHFREAVRILPPVIDAKLGLAACLMATGKYAEALTRLEQVLDRKPGHSRAIGLKGLAHYALGDHPAALETFEAAVEADPTVGTNYDHLGRLHLELGNTEQAVAMYEQAIARDPSIVTSYLGLSEIYRDVLDDPDRAARYERQARQIMRFE